MQESTRGDYTFTGPLKRLKKVQKSTGVRQGFPEPSSLATTIQAST